MVRVAVHRIAASLAGLAFVLVAQAATPVAFVTDVKGVATLEGASKVTFLREIAPETKLVLDAGSHVTLMYTASGAEFTLKGPGEFVVDATEVKALKGAAPTRRNVALRADPAVIARVSQSATASLRMRSLAPPATPKPGPVYPRGAIATLQPQLRWVAEAGVEEFVIGVHAVDGKEVWKGRSKADRVRLPTRLAPGKTYTWTVSVGAKSLGEALFDTLPAEAIARADRSRAAARTFADRVVHALALQDLGAAQDAREAWTELSRERPDLPELAALAR